MGCGSDASPSFLRHVDTISSAVSWWGHDYTSASAGSGWTTLPKRISLSGVDWDAPTQNLSVKKRLDAEEERKKKEEDSGPPTFMFEPYCSWPCWVCTLILIDEKKKTKKTGHRSQTCTISKCTDQK